MAVRGKDDFYEGIAQRFIRRDGDRTVVLWRPLLVHIAWVSAIGILALMGATWLLQGTVTVADILRPTPIWAALFVFVLQKARDRVLLGDSAPFWPRFGVGSLLAVTAAAAVFFANIAWEQKSSLEMYATRERLRTRIEKTVPVVDVSFSHPDNKASITPVGAVAITDADIGEIDALLRETFPEGPRVEMVLLNGAALTDRSLAVIGRWRGVKHLHVDSPAITDAGVDHLTELRQLEDFFYSGTSITEERIDQLVEELPSLGGWRRSGWRREGALLN